jgi:hypothetical protein
MWLLLSLLALFLGLARAPWWTVLLAPIGSLLLGLDASGDRQHPEGFSFARPHDIVVETAREVHCSAKVSGAD